MASLKLMFNDSDTGSAVTRRWRLPGPQHVIGRSKNCSIVVPNVFVSGRQVTLVQHAGQTWFIHAHSGSVSNSTFLNGSELMPDHDGIELRHGDVSRP